MLSTTIALEKSLNANLISQIAVNLSPYSSETNALEFGTNATVIFNKAPESSSDFIYKTQHGSVFIIGDIQNSNSIRELMTTIDAAYASAPSVDVLGGLIDRFGMESVSMLEGAFAIVYSENASGDLRIYTSPTSLLPLFLVKGDNCFLTTEVKSLIGIVPLKLKPYTDLKLDLDQPSTFVAFENVDRFQPGAWTQISNKGDFKNLGTSTLQFESCELPWDIDQAGFYMGNALERSVLDCLSANESNYISLSSGLDSALIVGLARRTKKSISACSVGSEKFNEFVGAAETANLLGVDHRTYLVDPQFWLAGILDSIYYNEIFDGLSAEIQSPLAIMYRTLEKKSGVLLTGYGADLLSGGMLSTETPVQNINRLCAASIRRTLWTLEFSPFLAQRFGLTVRHPFWTSKLINIGLATPGEHKIVDGEVKKFLRDWAVNSDVLPNIVARRPKIGVHEGSGVDTHFAAFVGSDHAKDYSKKNYFVYKIYEKIFVDGIKRDDLTASLINKLI